MNYDYKVQDPLGKIHQGSIEAMNHEDASQILARDGFQILDLEEGQDDFNLFPKRIKKSEIIYTTSQLAMMVDTGITLSAALDGIYEQEENPTLKKLLLELKNNVESGEDFSSVLSKHPKYFDTTFIALVKASEHTGTLGQMLDRIATYLQKQVESRGKVRAALAYPLTMLFIAIGVTVFLLTFVLPKFTPLFARKGMSLPKPTIVMMTISDLLMQYWIFWLLGVILLTVGFIYGKRLEAGKRILDWIKINIPVLSPMLRKVILSRSIHTLGTMVESGVSMLDSIKLTAEVSGNYYYEQVWMKVLNEVTNGNRIADSLVGEPLFPSTLVQMIHAGEETGKLDVVLMKISKYYDQEVATSLKATTSLIEPAMITVMGIIVGGIAISLLLPIFSLSRAHG